MKAGSTAVNHAYTPTPEQPCSPRKSYINPDGGLQQRAVVSVTRKWRSPPEVPQPARPGLSGRPAPLPAMDAAALPPRSAPLGPALLHRPPQPGPSPRPGPAHPPAGTRLLGPARRRAAAREEEAAAAEGHLLAGRRDGNGRGEGGSAAPASPRRPLAHLSEAQPSRGGNLRRRPRALQAAGPPASPAGGHTAVQGPAGCRRQSEGQAVFPPGTQAQSAAFPCGHGKF